MNAVIYARYSSAGQTYQSIEGQLQECYTYAERNGYTVICEYIDEALTGTSDNRPQFQKMIEDSSKRQFKYVLVYQLDRFARKRADSAKYKTILLKNGVRVVSARENISEDASGVLLESVLEGLAEYFSKELSQKVKRGMKLNAEKCLTTGGGLTFGYCVDKDRRFQIDEDKAAVVRIMFDMYVRGHTMVEIAERLRELQVQNLRGSKFGIDFVRRILVNRRYLGIYTYNDMEIEGGMPRIISDETFSAAQRMLEKNRKAPARAKAAVEYILTTKLFCGHCKATMFGVSGTSKNGKMHYYYQCINNKRKTCAKKTVQKEFIEDIVVNKAREMLDDTNIERLANELVAFAEREKNSDVTKRLTKSIKDADKQKANLIEALKRGKMTDMIFDEIGKLDTKRQNSKSSLPLRK